MKYKFTNEEKDYLKEFTNHINIEANDWITKLDEVVDSFDYKNNNISNYFDIENDFYNMKLIFVPFWNVVLYLCREVHFSNFEKESFKNWKNAFLSGLYDLWNIKLSSCLEECIGNWNIDSNVWINEKAMPLLLSGEIFHNMAIKNPIYAMQVVCYIYDYANHIREIVNAINNELPKMYDEFFDDEKMQKVKEVSCSMSDRHNHGRTVHIITFTNNKKIVYKPHTLSIDRAYKKMLDYVCEKCNIDLFPNIKAIDTAQGGFCTFMEFKELDKEEDAHTYFYNMGLVMGLIFLLRGNDMHAENIIAVNKFPMIVDMETVTLPTTSVYYKIYKNVEDLILNTMFLGSVIISPGFNSFCCDSMTSILYGSNNLPKYGDITYNGKDFKIDIINGYKDFFDVLNNNKEEFKSKIREYFFNAEIRIVIKPTMLYMRLIKLLSQDKYICDYEKYNDIITKFKYPDSILSSAESEKIYDIESKSIARLDVPRLVEIINDKFIDAMINRIYEFDDNKINHSINMIDWILDKKSVNDVAELKDGKYLQDCDINSKLKELAYKLYSFFADEKFKIINARDNGLYTMVNTAEGRYLYLDADLGAIVALAAYNKIFNDDKITNIINKVKETLFGEESIEVAMNISSCGLADGVGGLILGTCILWELGVITEDEFKVVIKHIETIIDDIDKLKYMKNDILYGVDGLYMSLCRIPKEFVTDKISMILKKLKDEILGKDVNKINCLNVFVNGNKNISKYSANNTLINGNAGILYNYIVNDCDNEKLVDEKVIAYLKVILNINDVFEEFNAPEKYATIGLFGGISGIVYVVCMCLEHKIKKIV